ncbi:MAG: 3-oxoacyl-ACP reductase FabG [Clostridia bacterium]|nr:3-oxoacyl-ACP reductase FabG [Clostridia bacterium]
MKSVLITGGARGIGLAAARAFAAAGYRTAITYCSSGRQAEDLKKDCNAEIYRCDFCDPNALEALIRALRADFPAGFDVLVHNAGISLRKQLQDVTREEWNDMLNVHLTAPFFLSAEFAPDMIRRGQGRIIHISSVWGKLGASCEVPYSAVKAGLIGMTKAMAKELAPSGVLVNCVCPGAVDTDMNADLTEEEKRAFSDEVPLGRFAAPEEIVRTVLFLAGEDAAYITGQAISVDGGLA